MTKQLLMTTLCLLLMAFNSFGQSFYYGPDGKTNLDLSTEKILVKFVPGTDFEDQKQIFSQEENIVPLEREMLLPSPVITMIELQNVGSAQELYVLLERLELNDKIEYANHFLRHEDGTLHGIMDKVVVRLKSPQGFDSMMTYLNDMDAKIEKRNKYDGTIYEILLNPQSEKNALEVANLLYETGKFDFSEPDFLRIMKRLNTNDPFVDDQWSLNNDGVNTSQWGGTVGADMKVFAAWNTTTGDAGVSVAIIDEGVDLSHPDLVNNLLGGYDATGQGSGGGPSGDDAHGTACAGIVAAEGNNSLGIAGVAYSSKIVPVRIAYSNAQGNWVTSNTWIGNAINWAWDQGGADVLSNSWGGGSPSSTIENAIDNAIASGRGGLGSPVLFAAGNDNGNNSYPATYEPTISVIAMSMCNQRKSPSSCDGETWWGSNYNNGADIAAPGVKIYATDISGADGYSSGDYISNFNGTSSACPNAAGVMALLIAQDGNLTEDDARVALETTCDKVGGYTYNSNVNGQPNGDWSTNLGYGRVNAEDALNSLTPPANDDAGISAVITPSGNICSSNITPEVTLKNFGANNLTSATINYDVDGGTNNTYNWTGNLGSGSSANVTLSSIGVSGGDHTFNASTSNPNGTTDSNTGNDTASSAFYSGSNALTLTIILDNYPEETSWDLQDGSGNVLASGGTYGSQPDGSTVIETMCVADGCYDFTIYDSYGDGICCNYGIGSYELVEDATSTVLASGGEFGSSETTNFCVSSGPPPLTVSASGTDVSCNGGSDGTATASASGGTGSYTYNWSNGGSGATITNLSAGSYTVTVDDGNTTASTSVNINEPSALSVSVSGTDSDGSDNGTATASTSGGTPGYSYAWSNGGSGATITGLAPGTYTVTATDANTCTATGSVVIDETGPVLTVTISNTTDVSCNGGSDGSATASASGGTGSYTYNWSNGGSGATISNLTAGTYTVTVDDGNDTATANATINEPSAVSVSVSGTDSDGSDNGTATASASGGTPGYTYAWSNGGSGATITGLAPGTYSVTAIDANGCTATGSVVIGESSGCNYVELNNQNFDSGWGIWNDGGSDCRRSSNDSQYANSGIYCVRLRDNSNSSVMTTDNQDYSSYDELTVDFTFYAVSMENNEDFWLQISTDGGSNYTTVGDWDRGDEFQNHQRYFENVVIAGPFTSTTRLRFRCDASNNGDRVYFDDVVISGCGTGSNDAGQPESEKDQITISEIESVEAISAVELFPNPSRNMLNVEFNIIQATDVHLFVTDINGKIAHQELLSLEDGKHEEELNINHLSSGIYILHLVTDSNRVAKKFVKVE